MNNKVVIVLGPTAVGKTKLAVDMANRFNGEIISADSRQVYKGMDIGTGKDLNEYSVNEKNIPYHLINILEPTEEYNLFQFQKTFYKALGKVFSNGTQPFLVGGTGLYIHSLLKKYEMHQIDFDSPRALELQTLEEDKLRALLLEKNEELHNTTDLIDKERIIKAILISEDENYIPIERIDFQPLVIGVKADRAIVKKRITARLIDRLQNGMIEEVEKLVKEGVSHDKLNFLGLEYRYVGQYLQGELNYNDMYQKLNSAIHKFAKRQMTWFRKMEKEGVEIHWVEFEERDKCVGLIENFLNEK